MLHFLDRIIAPEICRYQKTFKSNTAAISRTLRLEVAVDERSLKGTNLVPVKIELVPEFCLFPSPRGDPKRAVSKKISAFCEKYIF